MLPQQRTSNVKIEQIGDCSEDVWKITTSNMYVFAACWAEGGVPVPSEYNRSDSRRVYLVIQGKGLKKIVDEWWTGDSLYRRFSEKLRDIKEQIRPIEVIRVDDAGRAQ